MINPILFWAVVLGVGIAGNLLVWLPFTRKNMKSGLQIISEYRDRFQAWHRTWRSYKEPGHITIPNISESIRKRLSEPDWMQDKKQE